MRTRAADLDTPCLVLDLDILEQNLQKMQSVARSSGKDLRPHAKTHRCSTLARHQIRAGAIGVCAAKLSEAEVLADSGISGILITGPVVTPSKVARLVGILPRAPSLMAVVDHPLNVDLLSEALSDKRLCMDVLLDVDVGLERTGVSPANALELGEYVIARKNVRLRGIQAYAGQVQHIRSYGERERASRECLRGAARVFRELRAKEEKCTIFSGSGTGTFDIDLAIPEITELQVGSYALMDAEYLAIGSAEDEERFTAFRPALRLLTTVVSVNHDRFVTVDAGLKSLYKDGAAPRVITPEYPGLRYDWFGDEYGKLTAAEGSTLPGLGTVLEVLTSHCDPTVNLFDSFHVTRGDEVVDTWAIDLRGRSQ